MYKFKLGDAVRLTNPNNGAALKGAIGTIVKMWISANNNEMVEINWNRKINTKHNNVLDFKPYFTHRFELFNPEWDNNEN